MAQTITCEIRVHNPHKSSHVPGAINVISRQCTAPIGGIAHGLGLYHNGSQVSSVVRGNSGVATPAEVAAAGWVGGGLRDFDATVGSLVPAGFGAYARVLHPAYRQDSPVSWAEIAAANRRRVSPVMQLCALTGSHEQARYGQPGVFDTGPRLGTLPPAQLTRVATVLAGHTTTAQRCRVAVWDGWAGLPERVRHAPTCELPHRRYHLLTAPVTALPRLPYPVNLCWPEDRAWCLASDVDLDSTYLGGSGDCVRALIDDAGLECLPADPEDRINYDADPYNPAAPHPG